MTISATWVTVVDGAAAVALFAAGLSKRRLVIRRISANTEIYLGSAGVTISDGLKLYDENVTLTLDIGDTLYAVSLPGYGNDILAIYASTAL